MPFIYYQPKEDLSDNMVESVVTFGQLLVVVVVMLLVILPSMD